MSDFSSKTMEDRRQWNDIFKVLKGSNCQPRILYPAKLSFKNENEIKKFPSKDREFIVSRPVLQEIIQEVLRLKVTR